MLFERKNFTSHAGLNLDWKIECDRLSDEDLETLAFLISKKFDFTDVYGVPRGGIRFAEALKKYVSEKSETILIVDDVMTTGTSMEEARKLFPSGLKVQGIVIFNRRKQKYITRSNWIFSIFKSNLDI